MNPTALERSGTISPHPVGAMPLLTAALDALEEPLLVFDLEGHLTFANLSARSLRAGAEPFIAGAHHRDLFPLVDPRDGKPIPTFRHPLERALLGEALVRERVQVARDDERLMLDLTARSLIRDGAPSGLLLSLRGPGTAEAAPPAQGSDDDVIAEADRLLADVRDDEEGPGIICRLVLGATDASGVVLWEHDNRGPLLRSLEGRIEEGLRRDIRQGAATALSSSRRGVSEHTVPREGGVEYMTLWHEPVRLRGTTIGVLTILWPGSLRDAGRPLGLVPRLAEHAGISLERANLLDHLSVAASTDPLTGVANSRAAEERIQRELVRAAAEGAPLSLALLDLDHFRTFNQANGEPAGDRLLCESASAWGEQLRGSDLLARIGGAAFLAVLPDCPPAGALVVAERMRAVTPRAQTCSVGLVTWNGETDLAGLFEAVERALKAAKAQGRDRVETAGL